MAVDFGGQDITVTSSADLSAKQFYATTMETSGKIALADSAGEQCLGVLQRRNCIPDRDTLGAGEGHDVSCLGLGHFYALHAPENEYALQIMDRRFFAAA